MCHVTEIRCPAQCARFREIIDELYRIHLEKNRDYGPANILLTGEVGLVTRLWDKMARILSLTGFELKVSEPGVYTAPREPANESLDDSYRDMATYAIIGLLLREGVWGK